MDDVKPKTAHRFIYRYRAHQDGAHRGGHEELNQVRFGFKERHFRGQLVLHFELKTG